VLAGLRNLLAGLLILTGVFSVGLAAGQHTGTLALPWRPAAAGTPVRVVIPSLGVDARVLTVGLDERGAIAAPPIGQADRAAWYAGGPAPGQDGAAVIVGHVDDERGPAVFHRAGELPPGARIEVTRRDRAVVVFEVTEVRSYDKSYLPAEVYGDGREPALRLITCGGRWVGGETGYTDNVVVFARLVTS
jgi:hypothetical protein